MFTDFKNVRNYKHVRLINQNREFGVNVKRGLRNGGARTNLNVILSGRNKRRTKMEDGRTDINENTSSSVFSVIG